MNEEAELYKRALYLAIARWDKSEYSSLRSLDQIVNRADKYLAEAEGMQHTWCPACKEYGRCADYCDDEFKEDVLI